LIGNEESLKTYESNKELKRRYKSKLFSLLYKLSNEISINEKVANEYRLNEIFSSIFI
jgi:hypothetical protein